MATFKTSRGGTEAVVRLKCTKSIFDWGRASPVTLLWKLTTLFRPRAGEGDVSYPGF